MKAILLSIKPKYVADILNGRKTIEIRKTMPKCDLPIDVYIYCTLGNKKNHHLIEVVETETGEQGYEYDYYIGSKGYLDWCLEDKIVAKFTLRKVEEIETSRNEPFMLGCYKTKTMYEPELLRLSCLGFRELDNYLRYKNGYAWHIEDLVIFDKPKELSEFRHYEKPNCDSCPFQYSAWCDYHKETECDDIPLTKAPQSYCYVEVK